MNQKMEGNSLVLLETSWFSFIPDVSIALENTVIVSESDRLQKNVAVADTWTQNIKPQINQTVRNEKRVMA